MKEVKIIKILFTLLVIIGITGCVVTNIHPNPSPIKLDEGDGMVLGAIDPTNIPVGQNWATIRAVIDQNFDNINGTLDSIDVIITEHGDSVLAYSSSKLNVSDTAAMLANYALTSELDEFGSGSGDVIGADTITATRIALWSGQDSLTGDSRLVFSSTGLGALTYTGNSMAFNSSIIEFGTSSSGTGVIRGVATNSPAIINRTPTATSPNIVIHKNWSTTGIGGTYGSGTSSLALIVSNATKFQTFDTYNNSIVPLYTPASTSSLSGFRLPHGTAPSSPVNGDLWTTTGGLFVQVNSSTDTLATQEYARQYGGTGTVTISDVQDAISDSLNNRIGSGITLSSVAVMKADSTGNAAGNYVTRKALVDSIAAAGTGTGVSITDVREEIADSLNAIRSASIPGLALADSTGYAPGNYVTHTQLDAVGSGADSSLYVTVTRLTDSLNVMRSLINDLIAVVENLGVDVTAPSIDSIEIGDFADDTLVIYFNERLNTDSIPASSVFYLTEDANEMGIASISLPNDTVMYVVLDSTAVYGSTYLLDYTRAHPYLQDSTGNAIANFSNRSVINNMSEPAATGLLEGLIAYWDMQESSGNIVDEVASLAGVPASTAPNYSQTGRIGNAINFNYTPTYGSGTRFDVGDDILQTNQVSISVWIYPTDSGDAFTIISNNASGYGYRLFCGGGGGGVAADVSDGSGHTAAPDAGTLTINTWHHVVLVVNGTNVTTYINGAQSDQESFAYNIGYGSGSSVTIGANYDNQNSFGGRIDELGIWNRALTTDEIAALYNSGSGLAYSSFGN